MGDFAQAVANLGRSSRPVQDYRSRIPRSNDIGSAEYWEQKFASRAALPTGALELLQALSRSEFNDEQVAAARDDMLEAQRLEGEMLVAEYEERQSDNNFFVNNTADQPQSNSTTA